MSDENILPVHFHFGEHYRPHEVVCPDHAAGFSGARIYKLHCTAGVFCLRAWPPRSLPAERIRGLHRLLAFVHQQGVTQVSVPVATVTGATLIEHDSRYWQLEPWMPGRADYWQEPSEARLRSIVTCLRNWHRAADGFSPIISERQWFSGRRSGPSAAVADRYERICDWTPARIAALRAGIPRLHNDTFRKTARTIVDNFLRTAPQIAAELEFVRLRSYRLQPCLRDVWHDHFLLTGDEVTGLIDPSACRTDNVAVDLARLLGSLLADDIAQWDFALDVYHADHPLTLDERALVLLLDRSGIVLSGMNWLDRLVLRCQSPPRIETVLQRLQQIERRMTLLAAKR